MPAMSRRHAMQMLGAGAALAPLVASCSRSESASTERGRYAGANGYSPPPQGHFNFLGGVSEQIAMGYLFDFHMIPGAMYEWASQSYFYVLADPASTLSADGRTFTYAVRDGLMWSDQTKITAKDVYATWVLRWANGHNVFQYIESFEQTDGMTVTFHIPKPAPTSEYLILRERIVPHAEFKTWADRAESMMTAGKTKDDADVVQLVRDLGKLHPKAPIVSGPFIIDYETVTNQELRMTKNKHGFNADKVEFDSVTVYNGDATRLTPLVLNGDISYCNYGFPVAAAKQFESQGLRILRMPTYGGPALYFNYGRHREFKDKRVRQAIAHAIDRRQNGNVSLGESGRAVQLLAGFSDQQVPVWLTEQDQADLDQYGYDRDRAQDLLEQAGWTKSGGAWQTPDGKPAKYDLLLPGDYADWSAAGEDLTEQLTAFGIHLVRRSEASAQALDDVHRGRFDTAIQGWGSGNPIPVRSLQGAFLDYNRITLDPDPGMDFPLHQETDAVGTIDLDQAVPDATFGANTDELKPKIARLAKVFNELLPTIPLWERYANAPINPDLVDGFPADDDPLLQNAMYSDDATTILMYQGRLKPV